MLYYVSVIKKKPIKIRAYTISNSEEQRIRKALIIILKKHKAMNMMAPVYTCLKELLINAIKANYKNIYFEGYQPQNDSDKVIQYDTALKLFKLELTRKNAKYLGKLAKKFRIGVDILLHADDDTLTMKVVNPVAMTEIEKQNVLSKIEASRKYDDLTAYFFDDKNNALNEGAGLGIFIISLMLRNIGVKEDGFQISTGENNTIAVIRIPMLLLTEC
jgi:hypothetical protein